MRILVTVDGSDLSEAVLEPAAALARALKAEVHLLTVGHPPRGEGRGMRETSDVLVLLPLMGSLPFDSPRVGYAPRQETVPIETREQYIARREHELDEYLMDQAGHFQGLPVKRRVILSSDPAESIIAYSQEQGIDLITMATHGRSGISRLVQGSVASQVVRSGVAPVMLVRPGQVGSQ